MGLGLVGPCYVISSHGGLIISFMSGLVLEFDEYEVLHFVLDHVLE